jgi:hypothetical protein
MHNSIIFFCNSKDKRTSTIFSEVNVKDTFGSHMDKKPLGWIKTRQRCVSNSDESCFPLYLSDGRVASRDITLDRTWSITLLESTNYNMYCIDI